MGLRNSIQSYVRKADFCEYLTLVQATDPHEIVPFLNQPYLQPFLQVLCSMTVPVPSQLELQYNTDNNYPLPSHRYLNQMVCMHPPSPLHLEEVFHPFSS